MINQQQNKQRVVIEYNELREFLFYSTANS